MATGVELIEGGSGDYAGGLPRGRGVRRAEDAGRGRVGRGDAGFG